MLAIQSSTSVPDPRSIPTNAPEHCPVSARTFTRSHLLTFPQGTESEFAGKSEACAGCDNQTACASGATKLPDPALPLIKERMKDVKKKILILSGKGGVGKSTFTAQLGWAFAADEDTQVRIQSCFQMLFNKVSCRQGLWMWISAVLLSQPSLASQTSKSMCRLLAGLQSTYRTTWQSCPSASCFHLTKTP